MYRDFLPMKESPFQRSSRGKGTNVGHTRPTSRLRSALLVAAVSIFATLVATLALNGRGITYRTASAPPNGAVVAVRFVVQATADDITSFLGTYQATIIGEPRGVGFYRVRVSDAKSQQELSKLIARMSQEKIVDLVAVQQ
jgi:hypothetical protein